MSSSQAPQQRVGERQRQRRVDPEQCDGHRVGADVLVPGTATAAGSPAIGATGTSTPNRVTADTSAPPASRTW
ncbi:MULTISPECIES: hypothetical protein [unclassified Micromonospora]|uniref:hypothetical protein n=1 Tax=unclassified Micromonospora TaxID=2617518 RepID=UPI0036425EC2